jgi:membrane protease YdiL (CAAX protease family)
MKYLRLINKYLNKLPDIYFIIFMAIAIYVIQIPFTYLADIYEKYVGPVGMPSIINSNVFIIILFTVILGPIIETKLFEIIFKLLRKYLKITRNLHLILISALIFGSLHYYSYFYMFIMFVVGIFFSYSYLLYKGKKVSSFTILTCIHSLDNLIPLVLVYFLKLNG